MQENVCKSVHAEVQVEQLKLKNSLSDIIWYTFSLSKLFTGYSFPETEINRWKPKGYVESNP